MSGIAPFLFILWTTMAPARAGVRVVTGSMNRPEFSSFSSLWDVDIEGTRSNSAVSGEVGFAAIGQSPGDYWNCYSADNGCGGANANGTLTDLWLADGTATTVGLTVNNAAGAWSCGSCDSMYDSYLYPFGGNMMITVTNLPHGIYEVVLYSRDGAMELIAGATNYGFKQCHDTVPGGAPVWTEGVQYVVYTNAEAGAGQPLVLIVHPGVEGYAVLAGLQIAQTASLGPEPDHFELAVIPSPRFSMTPFQVTVTAKDVSNETMTNYAGNITLGSTNGVPVGPSVSGGFIQGLWKGAITISQTVSNLVLRATDGTGHTGFANPIDVINPPFVHAESYGDVLIVYWPVDPAGFVLESSTHLDPPQWIPVSDPPLQIGDQLVAPFEMSAGQCFYRLRFDGP